MRYSPAAAAAAVKILVTMSNLFSQFVSIRRIRRSFPFLYQKKKSSVVRSEGSVLTVDGESAAAAVHRRRLGRRRSEGILSS